MPVRNDWLWILIGIDTPELLRRRKKFQSLYLIGHSCPREKRGPDGDTLLRQCGDFIDTIDEALMLKRKNPC
jgi:hypothetical protein